VSQQQIALKFRDVLKETERTGSDQLAATQEGLLVKLVRHAAAEAPFYAARLAGIANSLSPSSWSRLPVVSRADIQNSAHAFYARQLPPFFGRVKTGRTSGSSGRPIDYRHEDLQDAASAAQTDRMFGWWGLDGKKSLATFKSRYSESEDHPGRRGGWRLGVRTGIRHILSFSADVEKQIDWLKETRPDYVFGRGGAHIAQLALAAQRRGERLRFDRILSTGSPMTGEARRLAKTAFKAEIADLYGASETGLIACQCPDCGLYHACDETILVEIIREDGSSCEEGELGRVVVTPLYGYAMPLVRYEIGDYATRGPRKAPCGRGLSSLVTISGRYRNAFFLRDGRIVHPYVHARRLAEHLAFRQIQMVQTTYDEMEIRYVPEAEGRAPDTAGIEKLMHDLLDAPINVKLVPLERFDVPPEGKFEETISLVGRDR
jgi:phenylacetate-CoA ligase